MIDYRIKPGFDNQALNDLYAVSWPAHERFDFEPILSRALTYVLAYDGGTLVGSIYVAWDGSQHAFLLEPTVHPAYRRQGIGLALVRRATSEARDAGCEWLHVDYEEGLEGFYEACGFRPTLAGLIRLNGG
jgi:GNAT superfamily N-acetyltransferase